MVETSLTSPVYKAPTPKLLPLVSGSKEAFQLYLTKDLLDKIEYLCSEFPTKEWSGVLFYNFEGDVANVKSLKITAFDLYPLDLGTATYTEFSHSADFAGYVARHPELMDARQGLIHSHNKMSTFFSVTDSDTLKEMSPIYGSYLSLIVNNAGTYTAALGVLTNVSIKTIKLIEYKGLDYSTKELESENEEEKQVVLNFNAKIVKETVNYDNEEFINSVEDLKKNEAKQSFNRPVYTPTLSVTKPYVPQTTTSIRSTEVKQDNKLFKDSDLDLNQLIIKDFIAKLMTQSYFIEIEDFNITIEDLITEALNNIPKGMAVQKYSTMVYDMIESLLSFLDINAEYDQISITKAALELLEPLKGESVYTTEVFECLSSFLEQLEEEPEEDTFVAEPLGALI